MEVSILKEIFSIITKEDVITPVNWDKINFGLVLIQFTFIRKSVENNFLKPITFAIPNIYEKI
jgi:hypothetical protein